LDWYAEPENDLEKDVVTNICTSLEIVEYEALYFIEQGRSGNNFSQFESIISSIAIGALRHHSENPHSPFEIIFDDCPHTLKDI
jgi:hypothetical protein